MPAAGPDEDVSTRGRTMSAWCCLIVMPGSGASSKRDRRAMMSIFISVSANLAPMLWLFTEGQ